MAFGVDVITSGPVPPNPSELLGSERMKILLAGLEDQYDYIIMDTPPSAFMTDAAVLSQYVDGVILVVAHKQSTYEMVDGTVNNLKTAGANLVGTVLTDVEMSKMGRRYNYYYRYRYHKYYEGEGKKK
jgi:capsular exopolysaccharide synthesis family protein